MNAQLNFNLDELDDQRAHMRCVKALDLVLALWDIDQVLRDTVKYGEGIQATYCQEVRDKFWDILRDRDINLDELIS